MTKRKRTNKVINLWSFFLQRTPLNASPTISYVHVLQTRVEQFLSTKNKGGWVVLGNEVAATTAATVATPPP